MGRGRSSERAIQAGRAARAREDAAAIEAGELNPATLPLSRIAAVEEITLSELTQESEPAPSAEDVRLTRLIQSGQVDEAVRQARQGGETGNLPQGRRLRPGQATRIIERAGNARRQQVVDRLTDRVIATDSRLNRARVRAVIDGASQRQRSSLISNGRAFDGNESSFRGTTARVATIVGAPSRNLSGIQNAVANQLAN